MTGQLPTLDRRKPGRLASSEAAYQVQERRPNSRASIGPCVECKGTVETWAAPLDVRVPPLCDRCQRQETP
jgi:hypothetical protein